MSSSALFGLTPVRAGRLGRAQGAAEGSQADGRASGTTQSSGQQQSVQELQRIDTSVRQHEAAHQATGGPYAGGASFTFTRGPDGKNYATAGEVPVDTSPERDPQATIRKMETVKAAALAPSDPSSQDLRVAQQADAAKMQAQQELRRNAAGQGDSPGNRTSQGGQAEAGNGSESRTAAPALAARGAAAYGAALGLGRQTVRASITV